MKPSDLYGEFKTCDHGYQIIHLKPSVDVGSIIIAHRPEHFQPWIVWRLLVDGTTVSGGYHKRYDAALDDYNHRK